MQGFIARLLQRQARNARNARNYRAQGTWRARDGLGPLGRSGVGWNGGGLEGFEGCGPPSDLEAGSTRRRLSSWIPSAVHVNSMMLAAGATALARARWLGRNNAYAQNALEAWATNTVGAGIRPNSLIENEETKNEVLDAWDEWVDYADAEGVADFYGLMHRIAREVFLAGECFVRFRPRFPQDGLPIPLQLQMIPSEQLPLTTDVVPEGLGNEGGLIRLGIEFDRNLRDRRVAYWFLRENPTDSTTTEFNDLLADEQLVRVPAEEILHIFDPVEAGQIRGVSKMAPAVVKLFQLDAYDDSELERQRQQSRYATFITVPPEYDDTSGLMSNGRPEESDPLNWSPGQTVELHGGEDVRFATPPAVGGTYEPFQYRTLLQISAALGIPYSELTNDLQRTTYASSRAGLVAFRARVEAFQHNVLVFQFLRPVWAYWFETAVLAGAVPITAAQFNDDPDEWLAMQGITPKVMWVDPLKDVQATILMLKAGLMSPQQAIEALGYDMKEVYQQIAEGDDLAFELGITRDYGTSGGGAGGGAGPGRAAGTPAAMPGEEAAEPGVSEAA